jgi:hypothetical protein
VRNILRYYKPKYLGVLVVDRSGKLTNQPNRFERAVSVELKNNQHDRNNGISET